MKTRFQSQKVYIQKIRLCVVREETMDKKIVISCPQDVFRLNLIKEELLKCDREKFICLHLNVKNQLISYEVVSVGSLSSSIVHPRELFKGAILSNASSVLLCHNHPSGDPTPSDDDIRLSRKLQEAGILLGIQVLDHLVFGDSQFISMKEKGLL